MFCFVMGFNLAISFTFSKGIEDELIFQPGQGRPSERLPFHSFLPPAKKQNCEAISMAVNNSSGGTDENVDLNLKL